MSNFDNDSFLKMLNNDIKGFKEKKDRLMSEYYSGVIEMLLDTSRYENFYLIDDKDIPTKFKKVYLLTYRADYYCIVKALDENNHDSNMQYLVLRLTDNMNDDKIIRVETDDKVVDDIFNIYNTKYSKYGG